MMYLPRLCEHCLNPTCVAACPSGSIYKREEDGIVLIDQEKCRGWRMCVSGCPYKKIYLQLENRQSEMHLLLSPDRGGAADGMFETVGRIRYLGVMLYDADRIEEAASAENVQDLYQAQLDIFLDPHDPAVIEQARRMECPKHGWRRRGIRRSGKWRWNGRSPSRCTGISHLADGLVCAPALADNAAASAGKSVIMVCPTFAACAFRSNTSPTC
jgi:nitrate reductase beta subunit